MDLSLFVSILAWFVAAFVSGLCGIGAAAIATAIQITVMPVQTVVLVSCLTGLSVGLVMSLRYFRYCRWKTAMLMFGGTIPGSLLGLFILQYAPAHILEIFVGIMLIFCTAGMALFKNVSLLRESTAASIVVGMIGGMLATSIYFLLRILVTCTMQASAGLYTTEILHYVFFCVPFVVLGILLSMPVVKRVNAETFRKVVQAVIVLAGILCLGRAIL